MKHRWSGLLLALIAALSLTACDRQAPDLEPAEPVALPEETVAPPEENLVKPGTDGEEYPSELVQAPLPDAVSVTITPSVTEFTGDDGTVLAIRSVPTIRVAGGAAAINDALEEWNQSRAADEILAWARESAGDEFFAGPYSVETTPMVGRADGQVVSLAFYHMDYTGGIHPMVWTSAMSFDTETGRQLALSDLTDDVEALTERLVEQMAARIEAEPDVFFPDAMGELPGAVAACSWYFDWQGLTLLCDPYLLAPYAAGVFQFTVPYANLGDILREEWLPEPRDFGSALSIEAAPAPAGAAAVVLDEGGEEMVLTTDQLLWDLRLCAVSSGDGSAFFPVQDYLAVTYLAPGQAVAVEAYLPDAMPNLAVSYMRPDGSRAYFGLSQSGKDGSLLLIPLEISES